MNEPRVDLSRRRLLKHGAFLGGGMLAAALAGEKAAAATQNAILGGGRADAPYEFGDPEHTLYTVCQNCNTGCGVKVKIQEGLAAKIDGSPYSPWSLFPHLPMSTSLDEAARIDSAICPKGQAAVQTVYDPYRIRKVLKRAGKRGENKWRSIPFDQAVAEIVEGGRLFADVPGEEDREVEGLRSIRALTDDTVAKAMADDVKKLLDEKDPEKKRALVEAFTVTHAANLGALIDPEHPDLGPRNNQFVMAWGRMKGGRSDFMRRFGSGFGTTNLHGHTTVCQGSLYFTCKAISEQYEAGKFTGGQKFYWQADTENARYILFVGANLFEANYGPTNRTVRLTENLASGRTRIAVADPRFSKLASKAETWLPLRPGEDAPLALAIIRWLIENEGYDATFLRAANRAAAAANGETSWATGSWLVEIKDGKPGKFVRASDLGIVPAEMRSIPDPKDATKTIEYEEKFFLVWRDGRPVAFEPNDDTTPVEGDLFVDTAIAGVQVKSGLQLLRESAEQRTIAEWCELAGVAERDVVHVARELARHGKQAGVDIHRGPAQHTNGFYNVLAWMSVNMLLGNFDWKGGMVKATTYGYDGTKGGVLDLTKVPGKVTAFGISSIRHDLAYEKTTLFDGYPAKRNWYPLSSDVYEEIVPSIGEAYPYPVKALFLYMGTPVYALPAGHTNIDVLADVAKLPLFFVSDVTVGTTSMYADYVFPDLTWLERWEFHGSHPNMPNKVQPVRQPTAAPIPETATVYGEEMPVSFEALLMGLAEKLDLKAFGPDALGEGLDLRRPEDFYLRAVANLAAGEKPDLEDAVPAADARELEIFTRSRAHLPASVFDEATWREIVGEELWPRVVYVLNRGGRFEEHAKGFDGDRLKHVYGKLLCLYQEKTAGVKHSGTGEALPGVATYVPLRDFAGNDLSAQSEGYDLQLITHRTITQTKSRTIGNYWLQPIMPENAVLMNPADADRLGLRDGQQVRIVSATNPEGVWDLKNGRKKPIVGALKLTQTMRPGVVSFVLGFGHWATGAEDIVVDGEVVKGDPRRATGIHANAAMWTDPALRHTTCLLDPVGGSVSFYDTKVRVEPA
ncbi:MAG: molybdopterin oxidoreductase [Chloroflexi bacterium GWC2_73_18]|nr:MAG: molybdopterin oxidoreductase [Chloroflexi bacterium GWC2_73_18]